MQTRIIKGWHESDGGKLQQGEMTLIVSAQGVVSDPVTGQDLIVRMREYIAGKYEEVITNGVWTFVPSEGECSRCGIAID